MKVKELKSNGLVYEFAVTIPAKDVEAEVKTELEKLSDKAKIPGFRPGKVPLKVLETHYGKDVRKDVVSKLLNTNTQKLFDEKKLRPAIQPQVIDITNEPGKDLVYSISIEIMPEIKEIDLKKVSLEDHKIKVSDKEVDDALENIARHEKTFEPVKKDRAAKLGDRVIIDFEGKIDDVAFPGGTATDYPLELGSGSFIDGFEKQLVGKKKGDKVDVKVKFPDNYHEASLKGRDSVFAVTIHAVEEAVATEINEDLAKKMGFEGVGKLKKAVTKDLQARYDQLSRDRLKRQLFDKIEKDLKFTLPPTLMAEESKIVEHEMQHSHGEQDCSNHKKLTKDEEKEVKAIAERRVRLGLYLAEMGSVAGIKVTNQELKAAIEARAASFPGQEKQVYDYYTKTPEAIEKIRAPLYEEKVVSHLFSQVDLKEKSVSFEDFKKLEEKDTLKNKSTAKGAKKEK